MCNTYFFIILKLYKRILIKLSKTRMKSVGSQVIKVLILKRCYLFRCTR